MKQYNKILAKAYCYSAKREDRRYWTYPFGLKLSTRATNCLRSTGAKSLEDVINFTEEELLKYKNLGEKVLEEIKQELNVLGLKLK